MIPEQPSLPIPATATNATQSASTPAPPKRRAPPRKARTPGDYGPRHLKSDGLVTDADRPAYDAVLRDRRTTERSLSDWLKARGYDVGRTGARNALRALRVRLDRIRDAAEMSHACAEVARLAGGTPLADGAVAQFETLLTEALFRAKAGDQIPANRWAVLGRALSAAVSNREKVEELRRHFDDATRRAAGERELATKSGGDATSVVDRVKEILGV